MTRYVCAVDVGTLSARAGIFDSDGEMLSRQVSGFPVHEGEGHVGEYASGDIWRAVCDAVRAAVRSSGVQADQVSALAFDATCSLVLLDRDHAPLPLGPDGRDTIAWFDHRALAEAERCTATGHALIRHLGQAMSPEMQTPKLMWLKTHRPDLWAALGYAGDLSDYLVLRSTGQAVRSACAAAAKWPYLPASGGWQHDFLTQVGLPDLPQKAGLTAPPAPVGTTAGTLTAASADALGLATGTKVATGIIDAFAGAIGTHGLFPKGTAPDLQQTLITGTSNCIMSVSKEPLYRAGLWGPYRDAAMPGRWVSEGGQSAAGALLDHVLDSWPRTGDGNRPGHSDVTARLGALLAQHGPGFGGHIHVLPDFNGNRSPLSDPMARGVISGLSLDRSFDALCALYWRAALSLALGVRQIISHASGENLDTSDLAMVGGLAQSDLLAQLFADVTGRRILRHQGQDTILLGTATLAFACLDKDSAIGPIARDMAADPVIKTPDPAAQALYERDYQVFLRMQAHRAEIAALGAKNP
ncbi:FGGY family pentulose kinase [Tropicibacter oceani]|uniref:FGGY family pentulose kinase n=1 Tax=Tropicibacter oceani TaxID=3058420 RepID=A0ABY8QJL7_9RHOB|nr:FGGY family pentulose kinase [Tropicibacter oceani]WGW04749.1 FGGY family pentulose kinase [Tropicibacter oceani]